MNVYVRIMNYDYEGEFLAGVYGTAEEAMPEDGWTRAEGPFVGRGHNHVEAYVLPGRWGSSVEVHVYSLPSGPRA